MPTRARLISCLTVVLLVALAGCGGGNSGGSKPTTTSASGPTIAGGSQVAEGKAVFTGEGHCGSCHTLADARTSGGVGPDLDKVLKGKRAAFIRQSIVDPGAFVAAGYPPNVMPQDFSKRLGTAKVDAIVAYLASVTGG